MYINSSINQLHEVLIIFFSATNIRVEISKGKEKEKGKEEEGEGGGGGGGGGGGKTNNILDQSRPQEKRKQ